MKVSFIIPAHNEESALGETLDRVFLSARDCLGEGLFEVIVADDASTDRTADIATAHGARVVTVNLRQIAAVRNAGARQATGDTFIFVDADTLVPEATLAAALVALRNGAVGGGAAVQFDDNVPWRAKVLMSFLAWCFQRAGLAAGCFVFCRRDAFESFGGFDERFFASEEIWISRALKQCGRFVIVTPPVITSGRKVRMHGVVNLLWQAFRLGLKGTRALQRREGLEVWYDGRREV